MNTKLINGEEILKSWDFAKRKRFFITRGINMVSVTNKRLIMSGGTSSSQERSDIELQSISGVSTRMTNVSRHIIACIVEFVIFGLCLLLFFSYPEPFMILFMLIGEAFMFVGLITLILLIFALRSKVTVVIATKCNEKFFSSANSLSGRRKRFKLSVDKKVSRRLIEELSNAILQAQEQEKTQFPSHSAYADTVTKADENYFGL